MSSTTTAALIILGANDEQTTCDRCGKVELGRTVILGTEDKIEVGRYGTTCAGYMLADKDGKRPTGVGGRAALVEAVRRDRVYWTLRRARRALENPEAVGEYGVRNHVRACQIVTDLERDVYLHRQDERDAVDAVRARAREIRAELRAAGRL